YRRAGVRLPHRRPASSRGDFRQTPVTVTRRGGCSLWTVMSAIIGEHESRVVGRQDRVTADRASPTASAARFARLRRTSRIADITRTPTETSPDPGRSTPRANHG